MITDVDPFGKVTLDANGNGQVALPSVATGQQQLLNLANVSTTSVNNQPACVLSRGSTSGPLQQIDSTPFGNSASTQKVASTPFYSGQVLWATWTGGDPGAVATLQAYGQQRSRSDPPFEPAGSGDGFPQIPAELFVGNPPGGPGVIIGADLPAVIQAFYIGTGLMTQVSEFAILMYTTNGNYYYMIVGINTATNLRIFATGWVIGTALYEMTFLAVNPTTGIVTQKFGIQGQQDNTGNVQYQFGLPISNPTVSQISTMFIENTFIELGIPANDLSQLILGTGIPATFGGPVTMDGAVATGAWTTNTPAWTGTGAPATGVVGTGGSIVGSYKRVGGLVVYNGQLTLGGTGLVLPGGNWQIDWPIPPAASASTRGRVIGQGYIEHVSTGATWSADIISLSQTALQWRVTNTAASGAVTAAAPFAALVGDRYSWSITYEPA